jgi:hypothetical protein
MPNEYSLSSEGFKRPFPALTTAQRYHFDVFGYVVVPGVFTPAECDAMFDALKRLRHDLRQANPDGGMKNRVKGAFLAMTRPHHTYMAGFYEYDDALLNYACHPRAVGMAEEVMGCEACITELDAHVNSRDPEADFSKPAQFGFHTGVDIPFGAHVDPATRLYHCNFVKTLTNLVDLGPDDGGTVVVAGSHKVDDYNGALAAAYEDRSLIHQVIAPRGSTLLFAETLIHATGQLRSDKERAIMITGYAPRMYKRWDTVDFSPEFLDRIPGPLKILFTGKAHWTREQRYRKLTDPRDETPCPPVPWPARRNEP